MDPPPHDASIAAAIGVESRDSFGFMVFSSLMRQLPSEPRVINNEIARLPAFFCFRRVRGATSA